MIITGAVNKCDSLFSRTIGFGGDHSGRNTVYNLLGQQSGNCLLGPVRNLIKVCIFSGDRYTFYPLWVCLNDSPIEHCGQLLSGNDFVWGKNSFSRTLNDPGSIGFFNIFVLGVRKRMLWWQRQLRT